MYAGLFHWIISITNGVLPCGSEVDSIFLGGDGLPECRNHAIWNYLHIILGSSGKFIWGGTHWLQQQFSVQNFAGPHASLYFHSLHDNNTTYAHNYTYICGIIAMRGKEGGREGKERER